MTGIVDIESSLPTNVTLPERRRQRTRRGRRSIFLLPALLAAVVLSGCGGSAEDDSCIVMLNGNTLCGQDAASWCDLARPNLSAGDRADCDAQARDAGY